MIYRIIFILLGLLNMAVAFDVFSREMISYFGGNVYLGKSKYIVAPSIFVIGALFVAIAARKNFQYVKEEKTLKCAHCLNVYNEKEITDNICPNCKSELEALEGFFDRHPSLK